uniref:Uncharacterized protein n=1 Tax=Arundo donax TaxID=35708 RepID=A0A0A9AL06_ARUDO
MHIQIFYREGNKLHLLFYPMGLFLPGL